MSQALPSIRQRHTVKVNNGSGVLIQPMSPDYAYVLTAKHCLQLDKDDSSSAFILNHRVLYFDGAELPVLGFICHDTKDVAILIVSPKPDHDLMISSESPLVNEQFKMCGFPEDRQELAEGYSEFMYKFTYKTGDRLILASETNGLVASNVVGFSGCGLFSLDGQQDKPVLLCAIETKMDGNLDREYHGNISAMPISEFELLIDDPQKQYLGKPLAPLLPLHLSNFEHLLGFSFNVLRDWADDDGLNLLQGCLRETATKDIKVNLFPHEILVRFEERLKVHNRPAHELRSRELWVSLLELLAISILIDKPDTVDLTYVEEILQSRRLLFIGSNGSWREHLTDILQSGLESLSQDGIIVTKTHSKSHQACFTKEFLNKAWQLKNIGRPLSDPRKITRANQNLSRIHSIVDLAALHTECIVAKEYLYETHTDISKFDDSVEAKLLLMLAKEYGAYLKVKDAQDAK